MLKSLWVCILDLLSTLVLLSDDAFVTCALLVPALPSTVDPDSVLLFTRC